MNMASTRGYTQRPYDFIGVRDDHAENPYQLVMHMSTPLSLHECRQRRRNDNVQTSYEFIGVGDDHA